MKHFFKYILIPIFIFVSVLPCRAQYDRRYYKNFVIANNKIYTLYADGIIKIFDADNGTLQQVYSPGVKIKLLTEDHNGVVVTVDEEHIVRKLNYADNIWLTLVMYKGDKLYDVVFNSKNDCFLITDKGIVNTSTNKTYFPDGSFFHSECSLRSNGWQSEDNDISTYVSNDDHIWTMFGHGEWGSDLLVFNIGTNDFCNYTTETAMPTFEINGHLFARTGNFMDTYIVQYDKINSNGQEKYIGKIVYDAEKDQSMPRKKMYMDNKFYFGGFTCNPLDGYLYIMSSMGLLKVNPLKYITKLSDLTVTKPFMAPNYSTITEYVENKKMTTKISDPGPPFFSKIQFTPKGKLVLSADFNGFFFFNGKKLVKLQDQ